MQFIKKYGFLILTMTFMILGFLTLKFSVDVGANSARVYLSTMGGSLDSADFNAIQSKYILSNIIIGGILLSVGSCFLFFSVYKLSKENS